MTNLKERKLEILKKVNNYNIFGDEAIERFILDEIGFEQAMDFILNEKSKGHEIPKCCVCSDSFKSKKEIVIINEYKAHLHCISLRPISFEASSVDSGKILGIMESKDLDGKGTFKLSNVKFS